MDKAPWDLESCFREPVGVLLGIASRSSRGKQQFCYGFWHTCGTCQKRFRMPMFHGLWMMFYVCPMFEFERCFISYVLHWLAPTQVHAMAKANGDGPIMRQWMVLGKHVSRKCVATILGMGCNRLHSAYHGQVDMRHNCFGFAPCLLCFNVFTLFSETCSLKQMYRVEWVIPFAQGTESQGRQKNEGWHALAEVVPGRSRNAPEQVFRSANVSRMKPD